MRGSSELHDPRVHDGTGPNLTDQTDQTLRHGETEGTVGNALTDQTNQTFRATPVPAQPAATPMTGGKFGKFGEYEQSQGFPDTMPGGKFGKSGKSGDSVTRPHTTRPARQGERAPRPDTPSDSARYEYVSDYPWSDATAGQLEHIRDTDTRQAFKARAADELNRRRQGVDGMTITR